MEKTEKAGPGVAEDIEKHISYRKCNGYCMLLPPWLSKLSKLYIYIYILFHDLYFDSGPCSGSIDITER